MSPPVDADLLAALRAGEPGALDRLYRDHAADVLRWVVRLGGPGLDAEAVAHDVMELALRKVHTFRGDSRLSTWLFGLTRGVVANARRRAAFRRFLGLEQVAEPIAPGPGAEEALLRLRRRRRIQQALEHLTTAQREVLVVVDLEGHTAPEAAVLLGIPAGTVYSRLHAARRSFRQALAAEGLGPDGRVEGAEVLPLRRRS